MKLTALDLQLSLGRAPHRPIVWQLSILQVITSELSTGQILHLLPTQHCFKCPTGFERGDSIKKDLFEGSPCVTALGKRIFNFLMASSLETLRKGSAAGITQMLPDVMMLTAG